MVENHKTGEKEKTGLIFSFLGLEGVSLRGAPVAGQRGGWGVAARPGPALGRALTGQNRCSGRGRGLWRCFLNCFVVKANPAGGDGSEKHLCPLLQSPTLPVGSGGLRTPLSSGDPLSVRAV